MTLLMCGICIIDLACCCILFLSVHFSLVEYSVFIHTSIHTYIHDQHAFVQCRFHSVCNKYCQTHTQQTAEINGIYLSCCCCHAAIARQFLCYHTYTQYKCKYKHISSNTIIKKRQRILTRKMVLSMTAQTIYINGLFFFVDFFDPICNFHKNNKTK